MNGTNLWVAYSLESGEAGTTQKLKTSFKDKNLGLGQTFYNPKNWSNRKGTTARAPESSKKRRTVTGPHEPEQPNALALHDSASDDDIVVTSHVYETDPDTSNRRVQTPKPDKDSRYEMRSLRGEIRALRFENSKQTDTIHELTIKLKRAETAANANPCKDMGAYWWIKSDRVDVKLDK